MIAMAIRDRSLGFAGWFVMLTATLGAGTAWAADGAGRAPTREELIGAWRLVTIQVDGPDGRHEDPFYRAVDSGLLVYDPSGWVSVQISGATRPAVAVPAARLASRDDRRTAALKARLFDSYYAYFGRWDFDVSTSVVTHHATGSVYPSEVGASYAQHVALDGTRLIFSRSQPGPAGPTVQTKVWERVGPAPSEPAAH